MNADHYIQQALALRQQQMLPEALAAACLATEAESTNAAAWHCAGFLAMATGQWVVALHDLGKAVEYAPENVNIRSQYALALSENNFNAEAFQQIEHALASSLQSPELLMIKADILDTAGYYDLSQPIRDAVMSGRSPSFRQAANQFLCGNYRRGLEMIAARKHNVVFMLPEIPLWHGQADTSLQLIVNGQQGFGDILQFARYLLPLRHKLGKIIVRVPVPLVILLSKSLPEIHVQEFSDTIQVNVPHDKLVQINLFDLPQLLTPDFTPLIETVPYLKTDSEAVLRWQQRLAHLPHPRIGLVWAGGKDHTNDHKRSLPLAELSPLLNYFSAHLISMQIWTETELHAQVFNAAPLIKNFADSAALIEALDLLICIDSAPAHLAGALNKPIWTLLPFDPDWRWLLGREDTIWYSSMRLLRQTKPGDWAGVMQRVEADLHKLLAGDKSVLKPHQYQGKVLARHPDAVVLADNTNTASMR